jgi:ATP-dependent helicase/nuclease subunit A
MELLYEDGSESPEKKIQNISGWLESLVTNKRIEAGDIDCINPADIIRFYNSSAGQRMKDAFYKKRLYRESPFMMGLEASRIDKELPEGELVLIQGIIDVWFEEDDGLVLLDYKTDKVKEGYELVKRYALQLDYYQEALEKITGKKVKERIIYSFTLGEVINL